MLNAKGTSVLQREADSDAVGSLVVAEVPLKFMSESIRLST